MVHCKSGGNGNSALKYIAPSVYNDAITINRIEKLETEKPTYSLKNNNTNQWKSSILPIFISETGMISVTNDELISPPFTLQNHGNSQATLNQQPPPSVQVALGPFTLSFCKATFLLAVTRHHHHLGP